MSLERLARRSGMTVRRGRTNPERVWLVTAEGQLFSPAAGTDEAAARALLVVADRARVEPPR